MITRASAAPGARAPRRRGMARGRGGAASHTMVEARGLRGKREHRSAWPAPSTPLRLSRAARCRSGGGIATPAVKEAPPASAQSGRLYIQLHSHSHRRVPASRRCTAQYSTGGGPRGAFSVTCQLRRSATVITRFSSNVGDFLFLGQGQPRATGSLSARSCGAPRLDPAGRVRWPRARGVRLVAGPVRTSSVGAVDAQCGGLASFMHHVVPAHPLTAPLPAVWWRPREHVQERGVPFHPLSARTVRVTAHAPRTDKEMVASGT